MYTQNSLKPPSRDRKGIYITFFPLELFSSFFSSSKHSTIQSFSWFWLLPYLPDHTVLVHPEADPLCTSLIISHAPNSSSFQTTSQRIQISTRGETIFGCSRCCIHRCWSHRPFCAPIEKLIGTEPVHSMTWSNPIKLPFQLTAETAFSRLFSYFTFSKFTILTRYHEHYLHELHMRHL